MTNFGIYPLVFDEINEIIENDDNQELEQPINKHDDLLDALADIAGGISTESWFNNN